jgi:hypothetical protein
LDHLHASAYVGAEEGDRFEVVADGDEAETVLVRFDPGGRTLPPDEVHLLCCACDWEGDRFTRWVGEPPT